MKRKNKYQIAVAIVLVAAAFSACSSKGEIIPINNDVANLDTYDTGSNVFQNTNDSDSRNKSVENVESSCENPSKKLNNDDSSKDTLFDGENKNQEDICVYICGAVNYPDVYTLPIDSRVVDAIKAAGGLKEGAGEKYLNLASVIKDGQKIYIPTEEEIEEAFGNGMEYVGSIVSISNISGTSGFDDLSDLEGHSKENDTSVNSSGKLNINKASESELMTLPGIGESKAKKIIDFRQTNGGFETIEDIMLIPGIKEGMFSKIKDQICVD